MTPDSLRALVAAGESLVVEFKSDERSPFNDRDLVEAIVCLANRTGQDVAISSLVSKMMGVSVARAGATVPRQMFTKSQR